MRMASENETLADIVAEIRARAGVWIAKELKQYDLRLADRIDAAWKRERNALMSQPITWETCVQRSKEAWDDVY